jgi:membrane associated rhomboid family serine protease
MRLTIKELNQYQEGFPLKKLDAAISRFCYNHPNFGIPNLMLIVIAGNAIVYVLDMLSNSTFSAIINFVPGLILRGEIWRLITFIFVPSSSGSLLSFVITLYFYYFIGSQLERYWGTARFNVFYFGGVLCSAVMGLIIGFAGGMMYETATMYYVNMSMFFALATLYPDMQVLLFYIIPVKMKYLAWLDAALFAWNIIQCLLGGSFLYALLPVVALLNYFIFFGEDLLRFAQDATGRVKYQHSAQTVNFKKAVRQKQKQQGYLHKCCVCGRTDKEYPDLEFRYCSRCAGYRCYCMDHINNHVHVTED